MQPDNRPNDADDADDTATGAEQAAIEPAPLPTYIRRNLRTIRASSFAAAAGTGLVFALPSAWTWFLDQDLQPGQGTVIGGTFVAITGLIAYTGTHQSRRSTERIAADKNTLDTTNADRAHDLTVTQELRARFVTIAAQFADPSPEIRLAGVYALEALTDDWLDRGAHHEAQTCINYYCGYLTRPYTPPT
ncbi:hypothetical protein HQ303_21365, partial [Rhodococcus sp. BP-110]|nr:hypothetical protein [Rhodococcus sp. BP-188]MBY6717993.1 hypothetical protein [Rhodococcus sp. BP-110]MBY6721920.1 hypothetical protein [Rhodococcus sp. BP-142]